MKSVAVIGGGPAGLMAAEKLALGGARVTVYEQKTSLARKFLMAGRGGLNLTHSEPFEKFLPRYGEAERFLRKPVGNFSRERLIQWAESLGQETFTGSSGRVFPKAMKASPLLRAWLARLNELGVTFKLNHAWKGWDGGALWFDTPDGGLPVEADAVVLALGGASWPKLGSDGAWVNILEQSGINVPALKPANCGFIANWTEHFSGRYAGQPLKPVALSFGQTMERGEVMITRGGLEGGAVYALSALLREAIEEKGEALLRIDMRPDTARERLESQLQSPRGKDSLSNFLRKKLHLSPAAVALLNEIAIAKGESLAGMNPAGLASLIKSAPVKLIAAAPIERVISSAGGVGFDQIDENFMLRAKAGVFVAGEMLDWEAPTGGYLLHACFATGIAAGEGALRWLKTRG
jgi:uncharacterized flavoprotein (TIGR03862 family)